MGLKCVQVSDCKEIEKLRKLYRRSYFNKYYLGWCDNFDRRFDNLSRWYRLNKQESKSVYSLCRVTYKYCRKSLPIDFGKSKIRIDNKSMTCEINNFTYKNRSHGITLIRHVLDDLEKQGIDLVYCLVDKIYRNSYELNTKVFKFSPIQEDLVFPDIKYNKPGSSISVNWEILVQDTLSRKEFLGEFCREPTVDTRITNESS